MIGSIEHKSTTSIFSASAAAPTVPADDIFNYIESSWEKIMTDVENDQNGSLDAQIKTEATALSNYIQGMTNAQQNEFTAAAGKMIVNFTDRTGNVVGPDGFLTYIVIGIVGLSLGGANCYTNYNNNVKGLITNATYVKGGSQPVDDLNTFITGVLDPACELEDYTNVATQWSQLQQDIANDKDGSLDAKIKTEAAALRDYFEGLSVTSQAVFEKANAALESAFTTSDSKTHQPSDLFSIISSGLDQLANGPASGETYQDLYNKVNGSITSVTYTSTGATSSIDFSGLLLSVVEVILYG